VCSYKTTFLEWLDTVPLSVHVLGVWYTPIFIFAKPTIKILRNVFTWHREHLILSTIPLYVSLKLTHKIKQRKLSPNLTTRLEIMFSEEHLYRYVILRTISREIGLKGFL
jgi:hypothetical protein